MIQQFIRSDKFKRYTYKFNKDMYYLYIVSRETDELHCANTVLPFLPYELIILVVLMHSVRLRLEQMILST